MAEKARKATEETVLMSLACGATVLHASQQAKVSERTVYRWMTNPQFRQRLCSLKDEMVQRTASMLRAASLEAVKTLVSLLNPSTPASVRFSAGRSIVELNLKLREAVELEERLKALEGKIGLESPALSSI